jgi:hypothetical protein
MPPASAGQQSLFRLERFIASSAPLPIQAARSTAG